MNDTQAKIKQRYRKMLLAKSAIERLKMASRMFDSGRKLVISGILRGRSGLDTSRLRALLFLRMYGNDFTAAERERIIKKIPNMQFDTDS
jgi:hypothetical protein